MSLAAIIAVCYWHEIELESETEVFSMPPWVREEVSGDERYYNAYLARIPYTKWNEGS